MTWRKISLVTGVLLLSLTHTPTVRADRISYQGIVDLEAEGRDFAVVHHHDWSSATQGSRGQMVTTHQNPFLDDNDYAYLEWRSRDEGRVLRHLPCPALTWLGIVGPAEYVVGLSAVKLGNPYQLVVYDRNGELLLQRHIAAEVAGLTPDRYRALRAQFPGQFDLLAGRIWTLDGVVYVDFLSVNMPERLGKLWDVLLQSRCALPFTSNITETVTNYVYWYLGENPSPEVREVNGQPDSLQLFDPKGERFSIPFNLSEVD